MKYFGKDIFKISILIIGLLTTFTIFLPAMAFVTGESTFSGLQIIFGTEFANFGNWASGNIHFSILGVIAYLLPVSAVLSILFLKKGYQLAILLFAISAVLLFMLPSYTKTTVSIINSTTEIDIDWVIYYGLYLAQGLSILGVFLSSIRVATYPNSK